jgi:hypothetical protein
MYAVFPIFVGKTYCTNVSNRYYTLTTFYKMRQASIKRCKYLVVLLQ